MRPRSPTLALCGFGRDRWVGWVDLLCVAREVVRPHHRAFQGLLRTPPAPARDVALLGHRKSLQRHATRVSFSRSNGGVSHLSYTPFGGVRCAMLGAQILGCLPALGPRSHGGLAIARTENAMRGVRRKVQMPKEALGVIRARSMAMRGANEVSRSITK